MSNIKIACVANTESIRSFILNQLLDLQKSGYSVTAICSPRAYIPGSYIEDIRAAGIRVINVPISRKINPLMDFYSIWKLVSIFRKERFTIVHTQNPKPILLGQLAAQIAGVKVSVSTIHGFYFYRYTNSLIRRLYIALDKLAARCSDIVFWLNVDSWGSQETSR